jgi:dephospho-CoA kinase
MLTFSQFLAEKYLEEKLIMYNQGKRYGQIVFLAGGAGSGKGFAIANFMEKEKFKVRDVDEWKKAFIKLADTKGMYPEIQGLKLKNPKDVYKIHKFVKEKNIKDKSLDLLLRDANTRHLPNIMFDITMKDASDIGTIIPKLTEAGYDSKNIHLTWVLTNYAVAIVNNRNRERVVADDIMLLSHEGAAVNMYDVIKGKLPRGLNGSVRVILNNRENTIPYVDPDTKKPMKTSQGNILVKDFTYLTFKKEGKSIGPEMDVKRQLLGWIAANVPKTKLTRDMMGVDPELLDNFKLFDKKT